MIDISADDIEALLYQVKDSVAFIVGLVIGEASFELSRYAFGFSADGRRSHGRKGI